MSFPPLRLLVPVAVGFNEDPRDAERLVDAACDVAHPGAIIHLLFVHPPMTPMIGFDVGLASASWYESAADIHEAERQSANARLVLLGQRVTARNERRAAIEVISPIEGIGEAIVAAAARHDVELIVLWSHGRRGVERLFLGSVAERVAHLARSSVLILRAGRDG